MKRLAPLLLWLIPTLGLADLPILQKNEQIDITTNFHGTHIGLTTFLSQDDPDARLIVMGPLGTLTFRTKERRAGLWINAQKVVLKDAATYVALVGLDQSELDAACADGTLEALIDGPAEPLSWICTPSQRDLMAGKGLFSLIEGRALEDLGDGFYATSAFLPPTAKPGTYDVKFSAGGETAERQVQVRRAGLERLVLETAENHRLFYGLLCLFLAGLAGYVTNLIFSRRA